jgi:hypothetical protein
MGISNMANMAKSLIVAVFGGALWAWVLIALWSGFSNAIAPAHDSQPQTEPQHLVVVVPPAEVAKEDAEAAQAALIKWKAVLKRNRERPARLALVEQPPALPPPAPPKKIQAPPPPAAIGPINPVFRYFGCAHVRLRPDGEIMIGDRCFTEVPPL